MFRDLGSLRVGRVDDVFRQNSPGLASMVMSAVKKKKKIYIFGLKTFKKNPCKTEIIALKHFDDSFCFSYLEKHNYWALL